MRNFAWILLLLPVVCHAYGDHRGRNLDSLERVTARYTPDRLLNASDEEKIAYAQTCRELAWGYLQLDGAKSVYYARQAMTVGQELGGRNTVFDMSILIGQCFWASERYDSARVHYSRAELVLQEMEAAWTDPDPHDLEANQARLWGTLGNFYAAQDSLDKFAYYYAKAGEVFEKWEWWEDCSTLHRNIGEVYTDNGDLKLAKPEYEKGLEFALQSGDSLIIAHAMYGLGRWYHESGKTAKALEYLTQAEEYFGEHAREEAYAHSDNLAIMNAAHRDLYRNARMLAIAAILVLLLSLGGTLLVRRLRLTRQELTETSAVLDETIEELRPAPETPESDIQLTQREKDIIRLMMEGKSTKQIADALCLGYETVLWYRKRLHAKLDVHSAPELVAEVVRRNLL
ncbi:MAG: tetratricopeptide repeat protein [Bacteroidales bacterium]|nr:tetratricopeptide repeat protein [Bacteroidales bacterium]